ncbi:MAG: glycosyltransferase [Bryobacteraceae bacterium]
MKPTNPLVQALADREKYRDWYLLNQDPIPQDRLLWRAQSFRHLVHLLPGQTILELGGGRGLFTQQLLKVTRGENPITVASFLDAENSTPTEHLHLTNLPGELEGRTFDLITGMDVLDERTCAIVLQNVRHLLNPGGQVVFFESNPWNPVLKLRRFVRNLAGRKDPRMLLGRPQLYELLSEIGLIRNLAIFSDFAYAPLTKYWARLLRNFSILLENMPAVRTLAGSILIYAQKPGGPRFPPTRSLFRHETLRSSVSVVVPCHNEEMNLQPLVSQLLALYREYLHEIILVDDNSTDRTADIIRALSIDHPQVRGVFRPPPAGVGRALTDGYRAVTGRYVLSMDCDFAHLLPELRDVFDAAAEGYDCVIGSRFSRHSVLLNYPFQKILANRGFHALARIAFHRRFRDLTNNLKLMKSEVLTSLRLSEPHFSINAETGFQPLLMGFSIKEVPISWINRAPDMGVSSFRLARVGGGYWRVLARLARETRFGFRPLQRASAIPTMQPKRSPSESR